jgi:hypothetical protein
MAGKWIKQVPEPCKCTGKPFPRQSEYSVGSQWQCDCGKIWEITKWNAGDQRDGPYPTWGVREWGRER